MHHFCSKWSHKNPMNYSKMMWLICNHKREYFFLHQSKITFFYINELLFLLLIQNYIYFFNPELQRNPHVPRGGRFLYVHWNGKDDGRILAELHACQTNRPRRRLPRVRLGLLWWKRFQVSLRFLCVFLISQIKVLKVLVFQNEKYMYEVNM